MQHIYVGLNNVKAFMALSLGGIIAMIITSLLYTTWDNSIEIYSETQVIITYSDTAVVITQNLNQFSVSKIKTLDKNTININVYYYCV